MEGKFPAVAVRKIRLLAMREDVAHNNFLNILVVCSNFKEAKTNSHLLRNTDSR